MSGIQAVVRGVRMRWRLRIAMRGLAWSAGVTLAVLFLSALALERLRFVPEAVLWLRVLTWGTLAFSVFFFLVRPMLRRVSDQQAALYMEEREPSLDMAVLSALDAQRHAEISPALTERLVESALARAREVQYGRRIEQSRLYRFGGVLTALAVVSLALLLSGPNHLRLGLSALLTPTRDAAAVNPYSISVEPGDATIARGSDQVVRAILGGFEATDASIFTRAESGAAFQRLSMLAGADGGFEVLLLGLDQATEYFVESSGVRSRTFRIDVADLPYVDKLDLVYRFPAYTGLEPRVVEDGGDVAALPGTEIEVRVRPTLLSRAGRLLMDGEPGPELVAQEDGSLVGRFTVRSSGFYSVELEASSGTMVPASPEYTVDALTDQDPSVLFTRPGRDTQASPIEEVYVEARADDDYGVGDIRLVYSVNGEPEDTVSVYQGGGAPLGQVSAGHTLFLEEWPLEAGDVVSYYALVRDNRAGSGAKAVASDMFFLTIRPFERAYRQADQQGGGQPMGGGQAPETALSELQRQIISATFNLVRQRDSYEAGELSENIVSVALSQQRLREQVQTLLQRMQNRGLVETDPGFRDVSAILPRAAEAMDSASAKLSEEALSGAIPHEQSALRYLQQAEETYERYVTQQANQGGGGGGNSAADDLADLFELELDKLKNQYETVQRGQQETADQQVDEVLEQLRQLARRQEQEAERQRRRAQAGQGAPQSGSDAQRELAEEAEEAARQLQRLARETNNAELQDAARQLQQAAEAMRQGATRSGSSAAAQADAARRRLEEARRRLEESQADRARRDAESALQQVDELAAQQRDVVRDVRELPTSGRERAEQIQRLRERKDQMAGAVQNLERNLDRSAADARAEEQTEAADALGDAATEGIRESKLREKIQYSRGTIEQWEPEAATTLELNIEADLQNLRDQLARALEAATAGEREADPLREALEDTRELVRGMEAMERRLSESTDPRGATPSGGATRGNPSGMSDDAIRQYAREFGQRADQARAVRDMLRQAGRPIEELQAVLDAMQRLEREGIYDNPAQVADLNDQILELLKGVEFGLRREIEGEAERRATLTGSDEVPSEYRSLVEEYYRALARARRPGGGGG